jgi:amino acid transporter
MGTSRLAYAMSIDGLFPRIFSSVHRHYRTPYISLLIQAVLAFSLSLFTGIKDLISFAVLNLSFSYLLTCLSLLSFKKNGRQLPGQNILPVAGILICLFL